MQIRRSLTMPVLPFHDLLTNKAKENSMDNKFRRAFTAHAPASNLDLSAVTMCVKPMEVLA